MGALHRFQQGEGEGLEDREHVGDLLCHTKHALRVQAADSGAIGHGLKSSAVSVHFVRRNTPAGRFGVQIDTENHPLLLHDEGFVGVVEGGEGKVDFPGQIHVGLNDSFVGAFIGCNGYEIV